MPCSFVPCATVLVLHRDVEHGGFGKLDINLKVTLDVVLSLQIVDRACHAWKFLGT